MHANSKRGKSESLFSLSVHMGWWQLCERARCCSSHHIAAKERVWAAFVCIAVDGFPFDDDNNAHYAYQTRSSSSSSGQPLTYSSDCTWKQKYEEIEIERFKPNERGKNAIEEISLYFNRREVNCTTCIHV